MGDQGLFLLAPVMIALAYLSSRTQPFRLEYPLLKGQAVLCGLPRLCFLLLGVLSSLGIFLPWLYAVWIRRSVWRLDAILVQTLASCLLHTGKPLGEIYASIFGGIVFGIIAWRGRSLLRSFAPLAFGCLCGCLCILFLNTTIGQTIKRHPIGAF